jgi:hypothetical protein
MAEPSRSASPVSTPYSSVSFSSELRTMVRRSSTSAASAAGAIHRPGRSTIRTRAPERVVNEWFR